MPNALNGSKSKMSKCNPDYKPISTRSLQIVGFVLCLFETKRKPGARGEKPFDFSMHSFLTGDFCTLCCLWASLFLHTNRGCVIIADLFLLQECQQFSMKLATSGIFWQMSWPFFYLVKWRPSCIIYSQINILLARQQP